MNGEQFKSLVNLKYNIESYFWAPEAATYMFEHNPKFNQNDRYQLAMIVLCMNANAFENRINGVIIDHWLSVQTFKLILNELILVMNDLILLDDPKLNIDHLKMSNWQVKLLNLFNHFKNQIDHVDST